MKNLSLLPYIKDFVPVPFNKLKILQDTNYTCILERFNYPVYYYNIKNEKLSLLSKLYY